MPKLWNKAIETHRAQVRDAILDAAASLVFEQGLRGVLMSQIAERAGIGRATLYKYFPDVETILRAWHDRQIAAHMSELVKARDRAGVAGERLVAVLTVLADITRHTHSHDRDLVRFLHPDEQIVHAQQQFLEVLRDLIDDGIRVGDLRDDVAADDLARYCLHALGAAGELSAEADTAQLVAVVMAGLGSNRQ
ncbi:TetR/AcrR family transcriptional regulator [Nocardia wallacei]|uniref:TetR/AcrR family transcriptional regulator n=1 Tax=Nocardia wallacei TaxID=480035 RepID=UPI0024550656|nr:TetR/AcrR family transcriptional regulator [Nocardia wallacei]